MDFEENDLMRPETDGSDNAGDVSVLEEPTRLSLIHSAVELKIEGYTQPEIAVILNVTRRRISLALCDDRAKAVEGLLLADRGKGDVMGKAQAAHRLKRAWEVVEDGLSDKNVWVRQQSAGLIISAAKADAANGTNRLEVIMSPDMAFDDQDLQDEYSDTAYQDDLTRSDPDQN